MEMECRAMTGMENYSEFVIIVESELEVGIHSMSSQNRDQLYGVLERAEIGIKNGIRIGIKSETGIESASQGETLADWLSVGVDGEGCRQRAAAVPKVSVRPSAAAEAFK
ncbi:hypothetical protein EVAR_34755_1 [Eumeta japonica]|uniref:Uncharacterized protein n=1 Tax=Eumeta variegata TaxID=151549 RepID=A0A4C1YH40_EUMVA|nr:hypothetical protein EVAR_34755_1 [Eumeta japonica]